MIRQIVDPMEARGIDELPDWFEEHLKRRFIRNAEPMRRDDHAYSIKIILVATNREGEAWLASRGEDRMRTVFATRLEHVQGFKFAADFQVHVLNPIDHWVLQDIVAYAGGYSQKPITFGFGPRVIAEWPADMKLHVRSAPKPTHSTPIRLPAPDNEPRLGCARWWP